MLLVVSSSSLPGEESQEELGSKSWQNNPISSVWGAGGQGGRGAGGQGVVQCCTGQTLLSVPAENFNDRIMTVVSVF